MALSISNARQFLQEPDQATLVLSNRGIGALITVGIVSARQTVINSKLASVAKLTKKHVENSIVQWNKDRKIRNEWAKLVTDLNKQQKEANRLAKKAQADADADAAMSALSGSAAGSGSGSGGGGGGSSGSSWWGLLGLGGAKGAAKTAGKGVIARTLGKFGIGRAVIAAGGFAMRGGSFLARSINPLLGMAWSGYNIGSDISKGNQVSWIDAAFAGGSAGALLGAGAGGIGAIPGAIIGAVVGVGGAALWNAKDVIYKKTEGFRHGLTAIVDSANEGLEASRQTILNAWDRGRDALTKGSVAVWTVLKTTVATWKDQSVNWAVDTGKKITEWFGNMSWIITAKGIFKTLTDFARSQNPNNTGYGADKGVTYDESGRPQRKALSRLGPGATPGDYAPPTTNDKAWSAPPGQSAGSSNMYSGQAPSFNPMDTSRGSRSSKGFGLGGFNPQGTTVTPSTPGSIGSTSPGGAVSGPFGGLGPGVGGSATSPFGTLGGSPSGATMRRFGGVNFSGTPGFNGQAAAAGSAAGAVIGANVPGGTSVTQAQMRSGATRNKPIQDDVRRALDFAGSKTGLEAVVTSGGQDALGEGRRRLGSTRHDRGGAADLSLRDPKTGRILDFNNPQDRVRMQEYIRWSRAGGMTGIGAGQGYMGGTKIHIGKGSQAEWGAESRGRGIVRAGVDSVTEADRAEARAYIAEAKKKEEAAAAARARGENPAVAPSSVKVEAPESEEAARARVQARGITPGSLGAMREKLYPGSTMGSGLSGVPVAKPAAPVGGFDTPAAPETKPSPFGTLFPPTAEPPKVEPTPAPSTPASVSSGASSKSEGGGASAASAAGQSAELRQRPRANIDDIPTLPNDVNLAVLGMSDTA